MDQAARHHGTAMEDFGLAIRGQLVDFRAGSRIVAADQAMRDAIDQAGADVEWDDAEDPTSNADAIAAPRRRGRPSKA